MDTHINKNWFNLFLVVVFLVSGYFLINHYFAEKIKYKSFEECLAVVGDTMSNWETRKKTINYCLTEN